MTRCGALVEGLIGRGRPHQMQVLNPAGAHLIFNMTTTLADHKASLAAKIPCFNRPIRIRSTFTEKNAQTFQPFFDAAASGESNVVIEYSLFPFNTENTLYKKVCDSLRWLIVHTVDTTTRDKYRILRATMKMSAQQDGIHLVSRRHDRRGLGRDTLPSEVQGRVHTNWQADFFAWLDNPVGIFDRQNLALSPEEIDQVKDLCNEHSVTLKIDINFIRAIK